MKMLSLALAVLFATAAPFAVLAQLPSATDVPAGELAASDADFLQNANSANVKQVAMAHTAETGAVNSGVIGLATRIASSHTKADQALRLLAARKHVDLPSTANDTDNADIAELHTHKRGADFDAQYMRYVVADHDRLIEIYEAARSGSHDADIRGYADKMLPALRDNRQQATNLVKRQTSAR
jgi:putative membrane protein